MYIVIRIYIVIIKSYNNNTACLSYNLIKSQILYCDIRFCQHCSSCMFAECFIPRVSICITSEFIMKAGNFFLRIFLISCPSRYRAVKKAHWFICSSSFAVLRSHCSFFFSRVAFQPADADIEDFEMTASLLWCCVFSARHKTKQLKLFRGSSVRRLFIHEVKAGQM